MILNGFDALLALSLLAAVGASLRFGWQGKHPQPDCSRRDWIVMFWSFPLGLQAVMYGGLALDVPLLEQHLDECWNIASAATLVLTLMVIVHLINGRVNRWIDAILARVGTWRMGK